MNTVQYFKCIFSFHDTLNNVFFYLAYFYKNTVYNAYTKYVFINSFCYR